MRWSKIKNIIILLLAAVNLCLLALVGLRSWRTAESERAARERMVAVLARSGIEYLPAQVPGELSLVPQSLTPILPGPAQAELLVGRVDRDAVSGGRTTYWGPRGSVTFAADGTTEARFSAGALPLDGADAAQAGAALLTGLGIEVGAPSRVVSGTAETLTFPQTWGGVPAPELSLALTWRDGELRALTGRWLAGTAEPLPAEPQLSGPTALARFLEGLNQGGYVCAQVWAMTPVYALGDARLEPAWLIETDVWPWRFAVHGATGAVTILE